MAPLQPLQQTVFEQGPQTPAVPTAEPAFVYQEGQVILPEPINPAVAIDPGINWYGLGEQAMGVAQKLLTETWDYLIETKENGLRDLGDKYTSQLDNAYLRLSKLENEAKKRGVPVDVKLVDGLITEIGEVKRQWKDESRKILGVGEKPNLFDPKVNVFETEMSDLGLKYQRLGLVAKGTERDIDNQSEKLLFQAQLLGIAQEAEEDGVLDWRTGKTLDVPAGAGKVFTGQRAFTTKAALNGMFLDDKGQPLVDLTGQPFITIDEEGHVFWNPKAHRFDPQFKSEWRKTLLQIEQNKWKDSAATSYTGQPNKEYTEDVLDYLKTDPKQRSPGQGEWMGMLFGMGGPEAINTFANQHNLKPHERALLGSLATLVKHSSLNAEALADPVRGWLTPDNLSSATKLWGVLRESGLRTGSVEAVGYQAGTIAPVVNSYVIPVLANYLGVDKKDIEQFRKQYGVRESVSRGDRRLMVSDETDDGFSLEQLLIDNPQLEYVFTAAMAFMYGNQDAFGAVKNGVYTFDEAKTQGAISMFSEVLAGSTGYVVVKDERGRPVSALNPDAAVVYNPLLKDTGAVNTARTYFASSLSSMDSDTSYETVRQTFKYADRDVFKYLADNMQAVHKTEDGERVSRGLPLSETLRLGLASSPVAWINFGARRDNGNAVLSVEEADGMSMDEKLRLTRQVIDMVAPASEWDVSVTLNQTDVSYVQSANAGLPIRIINIRDKDGNPIMNEGGKREGEPALPITTVLFDKTTLGLDYSYLPRSNNGTPGLLLPIVFGMDVPMQSVIGTLQQTSKEISEGYRPYDISAGSNQFAATPLEPNVAVERALVPEPTSELSGFLEQTFLTNEGTPLVQTPEQFVKYVNFNLQGVKELPKVDPLMGEVITYFVKDFTKLKDNTSTFFNQEMLMAVLEKGKAAGLTTNAQYMGLLLSAVAKKLQNQQQEPEAGEMGPPSPEQTAFMDDLTKSLQTETRRRNLDIKLKIAERERLNSSYVKKFESFVTGITPTAEETNYFWKQRGKDIQQGVADLTEWGRKAIPNLSPIQAVQDFKEWGQKTRDRILRETKEHERMVNDWFMQNYGSVPTSPATRAGLILRNMADTAAVEEAMSMQHLDQSYVEELYEQTHPGAHHTLWGIFLWDLLYRGITSPATKK